MRWPHDVIVFDVVFMKMAVMMVDPSRQLFHVMIS